MTMVSIPTRLPMVERWLGLGAYAALWALLVAAEVMALLAFGPGSEPQAGTLPLAEAAPYAAITPSDADAPAASDRLPPTP